MKFISNFIFILFFTPTLFAQNSGSVSGTVTDRNTGAPLEAATVTILDQTNQIVTGNFSNSDGSFVLDEVPFGTYRLEVSMIGFNTAVVNDVTVSASSSNVNVGQVRLSSGETRTDEIVIEGERSRIEFRGDRRVFNVEDNINLQGGSAIDVLKEVPSVTVDVDGNVSLRGNENVRILIDGRPSGLDGSNRNIILEQISANQIERVELITNPSARFDSEGTTGIINIVLKKSDDFGYNGSLTLNAGTGDKYTGGLNLNFRKNNLNVFGNYNYNSFNFESSGQNTRQLLISSDINSISQSETGIRRRLNNSINAGLDYSFSQTTQFGFSLRYRIGDPQRNSSSLTQEFDNSGNLITDYIRKNTESGSSTNFDGAIRFQHNFGSPGHQLTSDFSFSTEDDNEESFTFDEYNIPFVSEPVRINEVTKEKEYDYTLQIDYVYPFNKTTKLEAGYKGDISDNDEDSDNRLFDYSINQYVTDPNISNRFQYKQQVHGLYAILTGDISGFGYSIGGRVEQTIIKGNLLTTGENFDRDYIGFFPSVSISRKLGVTQELQISYSRRIQRPRQRALNPFIRITDPLNISQGNPNLNPSFSNAFELSYINYFPFGTITPAIFYRHTTDGLTRTRTLIDSVTTYSTFDNLATSKSYGGELIFNTQPWRFMNLTGSFSYFKTEVDPGTSSIGRSRDDYSWSTRFSSMLSLPADFGFQLTYGYSGKRYTAQGEIEPFQALDVAIRKDFMDRKLSFTFRVSDLFDTRKFKVRIEDGSFVEQFERRRDSRNFFVNVNYRFGTDDRQQDRRRRSTEDRRQNEGDEDFDF